MALCGVKDNAGKNTIIHTKKKYGWVYMFLIFLSMINRYVELPSAIWWKEQKVFYI